MEHQHATMAEGTVALARNTTTCRERPARNVRFSPQSKPAPVPRYTQRTHRSNRSTKTDLTKAVNAYRTDQSTCNF